MICAAVAWIMPTPRPYCATDPDSARSVCTSTFEPLATGSSRKLAVALAPPRPLASVPCAFTRARWLALSISSNVTVPAKVSATGPSRTPILPLQVLSSTTSVSSAPGIQGAMRLMSIRTGQACAGGSGTSKELSNSTETGSCHHASVIGQRVTTAYLTAVAACANAAPCSVLLIVRRHVAVLMLLRLRLVQRLGFAIAHHHGLDHLAQRIFRQRQVASQKPRQPCEHQRLH